jgi:hypothetical protein
MCGCGIELPCAGICSCGCEHDWETSYAEWRKAKESRERDLYYTGVQAGLLRAAQTVSEISWTTPWENHGGYMEDDLKDSWVKQSMVVGILKDVRVP